MSNQKRFSFSNGHLAAARIAGMLYAGVMLIISLYGCSAPPPASTLDTHQIATAAFQTALAMSLQTVPSASPTQEPANTTVPISTDTQAPPPTATEAFIPITGADCIPGNPRQTGRVVDIVDGDTIKVLLDSDGKTYTVRYIGIDTPENTSQVEYFGPEATAKNSELVYGKTVSLIRDVSETDRYGRLLRYVIADGIFVNYELVARGYANPASFPPDVACIPTFQTVEGQASALNLGLWGAPPTQAILLALPTASSSASSGSGGNAPCNCSGPDLNCGDFNTHAAAQSCYGHCLSQGYGDIFRLDGSDNDGLACESLP